MAGRLQVILFIRENVLKLHNKYYIPAISEESGLQL